MPSNNLHKINVYWISSVCYPLCQSAWSISKTTEPILLISVLQVYSKHNLVSNCDIANWFTQLLTTDSLTCMCLT